MIASNGLTTNEVAYRNLKSNIDRTYPQGHFVAIHGGRIVADDATLSGLLAALRDLGLDAKECLAVQAGVDYPEYAFILGLGVGA